MTKKFILGFSTIILLLQILFTSYVNYIQFIDLQVTLSNSLMSDKSVSFIFRENKVPSLNEFSELIKPYSDATIFSQISDDEDLKIWGVYGNGFLSDNAKSFIKGRFFKKDDFYENNFVAVIGQNVLNSKYCIEDQNGDIYFLLDGCYYQVIGIISSNISHMLDNTAYINLDFNNISSLYKFSIDSQHIKTVNHIMRDIKKDYNIDVIESNHNFIERQMFNHDELKLLNGVLMIFIIIILVVVAIFILRHYNEEINVKKIIGVPFQKILWEILKSISVLFLINTCVFSIIYICIYYCFLKQAYLNLYIINSLVFSCIILMIICILIYFYLLINNHLFYRNGVK